MNKVLIVTYYWPPGSGAGVQRWLKFSKYLPQYGWEPVILTVDPEYATWPARDNSLENEVPSGLKVYKTKATDYFRLYSRDKSKIPAAGFAVDSRRGFREWLVRFIRGNFFIPDPRKGWNRHAFKQACQIIENEKIRNVITTSPPHSTQLIGLKLKRKFPEVKWIADLRDPWTDIYYYDQFHHTFMSRLIDHNYEKAVLKSADRIITVGNSLKELFASKYAGSSEKIEVICNGYDRDDFKGLTGVNPEVFTISYIGTLSDSYPVNGFLKALRLFQDQKTDFRLKFIGLVSDSQKEIILSAIECSKVEFISYVDHISAIKHMLGSTVLLLIIPYHKSSRSIITGKLFEYMASGKPVLCLGPVDGDAAGILRLGNHGATFDYTDSERISMYLGNLLSGRAMPEKFPPEVYSRETLVMKVIPLLS